MDDLTAEFIVEATESLGELDTALVKLEKDPGDLAIVDLQRTGEPGRVDFTRRVLEQEAAVVNHRDARGARHGLVLHVVRERVAKPVQGIEQQTLARMFR